MSRERVIILGVPGVQIGRLVPSGIGLGDHLVGDVRCFRRALRFNDKVTPIGIAWLSEGLSFGRAPELTGDDAKDNAVCPGQLGDEERYGADYQDRVLAAGQCAARFLMTKIRRANRG